MTRKQLLLVAAVGLLTTAAALVLRAETARHVATGAASSCRISETLDCDKVQASDHGRTFGVSLSVLGAAAALILVLWVWAARATGSGALLVAAGLLALFNACYALYSAYVSWFVVGALCPYCIVMQAGFLALAAVVLPAAWRARGDARLDPAPLLRAALLAGIVVVPAVAADAYVTEHAELRRHFTFDVEPSVRLDLTDTFSMGPADARLTAVVYFDLGCPHCKKCYFSARYLLDRYPRDIRFVFKHYPLDRECVPSLPATAHHNACRAAAAAQAADTLGKGAEAMAFLFGPEREGAAELTSSRIEELGGKLGLDHDRWRDLMQAPAVLARRDRDIAELEALKISTVPRVFLNGRVVDHERLTQTVERLLANG
jgi:uncharacterized membrane protein/predicted DsbA family dithiol-disulfide isomerase